MGEAAQGLEHINNGRLDPTLIRAMAVQKYSLESVALTYQSYFERLSLLWDDGFNDLKVPYFFTY